MLIGMAWIQKIPVAMLIFLAIVFITVLGYVDCVTERELSLTVFYLIPISVVTWRAGRIQGIIVASLSAVVSIIANQIAYLILQPATFHPFAAFWNGVALLIFYNFVVYILAKLKETMEEERELARTDHLTGAANARAFYELADYELNRAKRAKTSLSMVYMDIDNFKQINDQFGHSIGDELLIAVAETAKKSLRTNDTVARMGGDEFVVLLPEIGATDLQTVMERLRKNLSEVTKKYNCPVTFSMGVVTFHKLPDRVDDMIARADEIMYQVKNSGKNRMELADVEE